MGIFTREKQNMESREYKDLNQEITSILRRLDKFESQVEKLQTMFESFRGRYYKERQIEEDENEEKEPEKDLSMHKGRYL